MKHWKPLFIENSRIPIWLSKCAPITITAITLFCIVISVDEMSEETKRHETIHFQQYLETGMIGFLLLYLYDYVVNYIKYSSGIRAYLSLRAEKEAYAHQEDEDYLANRKRWEWINPKTYEHKEFVFADDANKEQQ